MEAWRQCWRERLAPSMSAEELQALERGLRTNDPALIQGLVCRSSRHSRTIPCGACALAYAVWKGGELDLYSDVVSAFSYLLMETDRVASEAPRYALFIDWFDITPRDKAFSQLLAEVTLALQGRPVKPEIESASTAPKTG